MCVTRNVLLMLASLWYLADWNHLSTTGVRGYTQTQIHKRGEWNLAWNWVLLNQRSLLKVRKWWRSPHDQCDVSFDQLHFSYLFLIHSYSAQLRLVTNVLTFEGWIVPFAYDSGTWHKPVRSLTCPTALLAPFWTTVSPGWSFTKPSNMPSAEGGLLTATQNNSNIS